MKSLLYAMISMLLLISCSSSNKVIKVPVETVKIEYIHDIKIDSIHVKDSVSNWIKGDTVFVYREHIKYKYLNKIDTVVKTDTIPKIIEVKTKEVVEVNHINWYLKTLMWIGGITILLVIGTIIYKFKIR